MTFLITLFSLNPYIEFPAGLIGWLGWLILFGLNILALRKWRASNRIMLARNNIILAGLLLAAILTSLFIAVRLPAGRGLTPPEIPVDPIGPAILVFSTLPWVLAAGIFGPAAAAVIGFASGLVQALWETHNSFTPLEIMLMAVFLSACLRQRYRTSSFRLLGHPIIATILTALLYPILFLISTMLSARGVLVSRLDYAITQIGNATLAVAIELLIAGLFAEIIMAALPHLWDRRGPLEPSPAEKSLQARFLYSMAPMALVLIITLTVSDWIIADNAAREMLKERMASAAEMAAEGVPYFLETGQNLITQLAADPSLYTSSRDELPELLAEDLRNVPFFRQLYVLDMDGKSVAGFPSNNYAASQAPAEEQMGVQLALNGVPVQSYSVPPMERESAAQVSFVAMITDEYNLIRGVLVGRSDLATNPFSMPVLASLNNLADDDGIGMLLDENNRILYHPEPGQIMSTFPGTIPQEPSFYDGTASNGTRQLVYFQRATGRPWSVVLMVPAHKAQQLALRIAAPLLAILIILSVLAVIMLRFGMRMITASLQNLALEADRISHGQLDNPLMVSGEDEVGQLRRAFEQMRGSLKARLDELNRLLLVSQGVASSLEIQEAVGPVLESALAMGATSARVVLSPTVMPNLEGDSPAPISFGMGSTKDLYADLDDQILALAHQQERLVLSNLTRPRLLNLSPNASRPESLLAIALRHENQYYGALWVAYDRHHVFAEEEVRFVITLASQAAIAAANTRLFLNAEIGRQRLAAILASSPDPVLVTDQNDRLLLANPAAWQVLNLGMESDEGQPIEQVITQKELIELLHSPTSDKQTIEVVLPGDKVYLATVSSVLAEGQRVGQVCVLRDVTHFKELDALKSEFVSTVSHDLRSPLTLMRGYATMLEMVGQLNEQQTGYVRKIVNGVESMSRLVNNLLDLGRIEAGIGLQVEMVPVQDIIEREISALQLEASQKKIQLVVEIPPGNAPLLEADQSLLQQALHNLIENAIKYTRPEGKVTVRVQTRQERMVFEVSDTGIGVSPMDQPRLFERFYRGAQGGSKEQRGTGLGLAIVKSIAERHGGQVWLESQLGKGSTFSFSIPTRQPVKENPL